jgi:methylase of polypeptide subunit release factors
VKRVADLGCGVGGNTLGFARAGLTVVAVERDAARLACARHNARLYGVEDRITFLQGDALALATACAADLWFCDPPWGEDWPRTAVSPEGLSPLPALLELRAGRALWAKVPPSADLTTWSDKLGEALTIEPVFGLAAGDQQRVKCLWVRCAAVGD